MRDRDRGKLYHVPTSKNKVRIVFSRCLYKYSVQYHTYAAKLSCCGSIPSSPPGESYMIHPSPNERVIGGQGTINYHVTHLPYHLEMSCPSFPVIGTTLYSTEEFESERDRRKGGGHSLCADPVGTLHIFRSRRSRIIRQSTASMNSVLWWSIGWISPSVSTITSWPGRYLGRLRIAVPCARRRSSDVEVPDFQGKSLEIARTI